MAQAGADMHDLEREIVAKMGDATIPQVKVVTGALLEMGLFTLNSLLETPVDKERMVTIMEKRAATAMIESFNGEVWRARSRTSPGSSLSQAPRVSRRTLCLLTTPPRKGRSLLCARLPRNLDHLSRRKRLAHTHCF